MDVAELTTARNPPNPPRPSQSGTVSAVIHPVLYLTGCLAVVVVVVVVVVIVVVVVLSGMCDASTTEFVRLPSVPSAALQREPVAVQVNPLTAAQRLPAASDAAAAPSNPSPTVSASSAASSSASSHTPQLSVGAELLSGSVSAVVSRAVISPLDVLKIRQQLCVERRPASLISTLHSMVASEGVLSLWKGNLAAELMVVPYGAVSFLTYSTVKRTLQSWSTSPSLSSSSSPLLLLLPVSLSGYIPLLAGSASGVCATLATYPLDLLRTRFVAQRSSAPLLYTSLWHAVSDIVARDGLSGLYRGLWPTLVGIVPLMALQFQTYETAKRTLTAYNQRPHHHTQQQHEVALSASQQSGCGFVAGVVSKWLTMPLDVIKKRCQVHNFIQLQQHALPLHQHPITATVSEGRSGGCGVLSMGRSIVRSEGVVGLFKGSVASLLKAGPNAALIYVVYEQCRAFISRHQQSSAE